MDELKKLLETYEIVKEARKNAETKRKEIMTENRCRTAFDQIYDFFDGIVCKLDEAGVKECELPQTIKICGFC